ncbi:MAG: hypothetical protein K6U80_18645 [Firmicutes bacterium]|nr:hypothetical protein [Bacillota bacterium]
MLIPIIILFILLLIMGIIIYNYKKNHSSLKKEVDTLTLEEVIAWFKQPLIIKELRENKNLLAVGIKKPTQKPNLNITLCLYDTNKEQIFKLKDTFITYNANQLSPDLQQMFGDKQMIVFQ